jgi:hypothetical protein
MKLCPGDVAVITRTVALPECGHRVVLTCEEGSP